MYEDDPALLELFGPEFAAKQEAEHQSEREKHELLAAFADVFDTDAGKRVFWWLLGQTHLYQTSFTGNSLTYFKEGERQVGLKLLGKIVEARPLGLHDLIMFKRKQENEE